MVSVHFHKDTPPTVKCANRYYLDFDKTIEKRVQKQVSLESQVKNTES